MIYYKDDGYSETEFIGIATKSFEPEKFRAAARYLESMRNRQNSEVMTMPEIKLKPLLYPYIQEAGKLRDFSDKKVNISGKYYDLNIFILSQAQENEWSVTLPIAL